MLRSINIHTSPHLFFPYVLSPVVLSLCLHPSYSYSLTVSVVFLVRAFLEQNDAVLQTNRINIWTKTHVCRWHFVYDFDHLSKDIHGHPKNALKVLP